MFTKTVKALRELLTDESDLTCEDCGRSMLTRFGRGIPYIICPSCNDEFDRLNKAGKLWIEND